MSATVIAAIDDSAAAEPVIEAALGLADRLDAQVQALHVVREGQGTAEEVAASLGVPMRIVEGPPARAIIRALAEESVVAGAMGARTTRGGPRPVAPTTLDVLLRATKPVAVVPPEASGALHRHFRRILVPLDATQQTAEAVRPLVSRLAGERSEVVVLHVFSEASVPQFLDHRHRDLDTLAKEFLGNYWAELPGRVEWGTGDPAQCVLDRARGDSTDLVVMSWRRKFTPTRATVVHTVLSGSEVPVLLVPLLAL